MSSRHVQANIATSLINIRKNLESGYIEYEKHMNKSPDETGATMAHLNAVNASLMMMKSAMNTEIKRIAKEIEK